MNSIVIVGRAVRDDHTNLFGFIGQFRSGQSQRTDIKGFVEPYEVFSKTITFYVRET